VCNFAAGKNTQSFKDFAPLYMVCQVLKKQGSDTPKPSALTLTLANHITSDPILVATN
jgi:hypothetical protein